MYNDLWVPLLSDNNHWSVPTSLVRLLKKFHTARLAQGHVSPRLFDSK